MDTLHTPELCTKTPAILRDGFSWTLARLALTFINLQNEALAELDLTMRSFAVLATVSEQVARTQLEIAQMVGLDKSTLVTTIDELEKRGLVERRADPSDRRARVVESTASGRDLAVRAAEKVRQTERNLLGELGAAEAARLNSSLVALLRDALHGETMRSGSCL